MLGTKASRRHGMVSEKEIYDEEAVAGWSKMTTVYLREKEEGK